MHPHEEHEEHGELDAELVKWVSSAEVPTPEKGEHFCEWQVIVEYGGRRSTATARCDYRTGNAYDNALKKHNRPDVAAAKLVKIRADLGPMAEAKAKRRALHLLGFSHEQAAKIIGCGKGHS